MSTTSQRRDSHSGPGRRVQANGLSFHVVEQGRGESVLLLQGFPDTSRLWRNQFPALESAGFRAVAPDLRGRGESPSLRLLPTTRSRSSWKTCSPS
jgi:Predicted hydrolases or acyltransferases (alpha/beta hydrolase superfamily)